MRCISLSREVTGDTCRLLPLLPVLNPFGVVQWVEWEFVILCMYTLYVSVTQDVLFRKVVQIMRSL